MRTAYKALLPVSSTARPQSATIITMDSERTHNRIDLYVLLPIVSGACWGLAGIFVRVFTEAGLDNPTIVFTRTAVCTLLTLIYILIKDRKREPGARTLLYIRLRDLPFVLAIAVFGSLILMICYNIAVKTLSLSLAAILLCTAPIFVLLISAVVFHEKITLKKVICMLVALTGCAFLSGLFSGGLYWSGFGLLMGAAAALCNAVFIIMSKAIAIRGYSSFTVTFWASLFASLILCFIIDWHALISYLAASPLSGTLLMLTQSVITSLLPSLIYVVAMRHVEAGRVAILQSGAEPTAAFLAGLLLYAETPTPAGLIGMAITILALMVLAGDRS